MDFSKAMRCTEVRAARLMEPENISARWAFMAAKPKVERGLFAKVGELLAGAGGGVGALLRYQNFRPRDAAQGCGQPGSSMQKFVSVRVANSRLRTTFGPRPFRAPA